MRFAHSSRASGAVRQPSSPRAAHPRGAFLSYRRRSFLYDKNKPSSVKGQGLSRVVVPPHTGYSGHPFISASRNGGKPSEPTCRAFSLLLRSDIQCPRTCTGSHQSRLSETFRGTYCLRQCISNIF